MFNFWHKPKYSGRDSEGYQPTPPVDPPTIDPCYYTVGITETGCTVLKINDDNGHSSITLTMDRTATQHMIRLLEATLITDQLGDIK